VVNRSVMAAVITGIVFLSGLSFGLFWDSLRESRVKQEMDELVVYSSALFLESQLIEEAGCDSMRPILDEAVGEISESLERYETYMEGARLDLDSSRILYRRYLMSNIRYWFFLREFKEKCGVNNTIILFFFGDDCPECEVMSQRLNYVKNKYEEDVLIFPINMELAVRDPVANTLEGLYNVTSYPALVVEDQKYGVISKEELEGLVCGGNC